MDLCTYKASSCLHSFRFLLQLLTYKKVTYKLLSHKRYKKEFCVLEIFSKFFCCSKFFTQLGKCEKYKEPKIKGFYMHMLTSCVMDECLEEKKNFLISHRVKDEWRVFSRYNQ